MHYQAYPLRIERFSDCPRKALGLEENMSRKIVRDVTEMVDVLFGNNY